jgi:hypothetical protein
MGHKISLSLQPDTLSSDLQMDSPVRRHVTRGTRLQAPDLGLFGKKGNVDMKGGIYDHAIRQFP